MSTFEFVIAAGVGLAAPLLWAALGELVSEKSGTLNLGIEGVMGLGVLGAALGYQKFESITMALLFAVALGLAAGVVLAVLYVFIGTDQIVTGILFSMVAIGTATVVAGATLRSPRAHSLAPVDVPLLGRTPLLGSILFRQNVLVYFAIVMVPVIWFVMNRTWFGLHVRAVGHRARVLESAGLSVRRTRSMALVLSCVFVAVGGATLTLSTASTYQPGTTAGRGYIALVIVVLARWNPWGVALGALLFGTAQALQFQVEAISWLSGVPFQFVLMAPYAVAVIAVVILRGSRYPASVGLPYRPAESH